MGRRPYKTKEQWRTIFKGIDTMSNEHLLEHVIETACEAADDEDQSRTAHLAATECAFALKVLIERLVKIGFLKEDISLENFRASAITWQDLPKRLKDLDLDLDLN